MSASVPGQMSHGPAAAWEGYCYSQALMLRCKQNLSGSNLAPASHKPSQLYLRPNINIATYAEHWKARKSKISLDKYLGYFFPSKGVAAPAAAASHRKGHRQKQPSQLRPKAETKIHIGHRLLFAVEGGGSSFRSLAGHRSSHTPEQTRQKQPNLAIFLG